MAWLRGGDITPDPEMENSFLDIMTAAVAERLIANRQEYSSISRTASDAMPGPRHVSCLLLTFRKDHRGAIPAGRTLIDGAYA